MLQCLSKLGAVTEQLAFKHCFSVAGWFGVIVRTGD